MRRTFVYDPKSRRLVEGKAPKPKDTGDRLMSDRLYAKLPPAHDGSKLDTRTKHRQYMKRNGLTTVDDFKDTWAQAQKKRDAFYSGQHSKAERHERAMDISRAMDQVQARRKG